MLQSAGDFLAVFSLHFGSIERGCILVRVERGDGGVVMSIASIQSTIEFIVSNRGRLLFCPQMGPNER